jgi:hypothetical protein
MLKSIVSHRNIKWEFHCTFCLPLDVECYFLSWYQDKTYPVEFYAHFSTFHSALCVCVYQIMNIQKCTMWDTESTVTLKWKLWRNSCNFHISISLFSPYIGFKVQWVLLVFLISVTIQVCVEDPATWSCDWSENDGWKGPKLVHMAGLFDVWTSAEVCL